MRSLIEEEDLDIFKEGLEQLIIDGLDELKRKNKNLWYRTLHLLNQWRLDNFVKR
jgi:hypothetical protein